MLLIQVVKSEKSINLFYDIFALFSLQQKHSKIWGVFFFGGRVLDTVIYTQRR